MAIQWGIWRAGGIAVPLAVSHPPPELEYTIRDSDASVVVVHPDFTAVMQSVQLPPGTRAVTTHEAVSTPPRRHTGEQGAESSTHRFSRRDGAQPGREFHRGDAGGELRVHHDGLGVGVADHVLELGGRVGDGERNGDAAGPPDSPLDRHVVKAWTGEIGDPGLREVVPPGEQALGDACRGVEQVAIAERAFSGDDGRPVTVPPRAGDEGQLRQRRASITSRTLRASAPSENGFCRKATPSSRTP